jgi:hypothetical protein
MKTKNPRFVMLLSALLAMLAAGASGQRLSRISPSHKGFLQDVNQQAGDVPAGSQQWSLLFPTDILDERGAAAAVYDQPTNSLIVFSGGNYVAVPNDVMALSNANGIGTPDWTTVIPNGAPGSPAARTFSTGVYDQANSRMIVFGGCSFTGEFCTSYLNDVWVLVNANGLSGAPTWEQLAPAGTPPAPRWAQGAAYDPVNNRMIVYGGDNQSIVFSDAWVLSNANGLGGTPTWTQLSPAGGPPEGQDSPSVAYDSTNNILIEFAGTMNDFGQDANSVWTLSNANGLGGAPVWKNIMKNGKGGPPKRDGLVSAYDSTNNRLMIFGGDANTPSGFPQLNDAWVLANANELSGKPKWMKLAPSGTKPGGRTSAMGGYDAANNRLIIYGGVSWDADFFSTWVLTGANGLQ